MIAFVRGFAVHVLPPVLVFLAVTATIETISRTGLVPPFLVPAPSVVLETIWLQWSSELGPALWETTLASLMGFGISVLVGTAISVALSSSRWIMRAFYPWAVVFQTVPLIAIAPLLIIWFGDGPPSVVVSAVIVSIFPVIANTLAGLRSTDPALVDLFRLYGASTLATLWKLKLPAALPSMLTGWRIGAGLAVIGVIVGENFAPQGLGATIDAAKDGSRINLIFAAVLLASLLGLALFGLINFISYLALRNWHASEQKG